MTTKLSLLFSWLAKARPGLVQREVLVRRTGRAPFRRRQWVSVADEAAAAADTIINEDTKGLQYRRKVVIPALVRKLQRAQDEQLFASRAHKALALALRAEGKDDSGPLRLWKDAKAKSVEHGLQLKNLAQQRKLIMSELRRRGVLGKQIAPNRSVVAGDEEFLLTAKVVNRASLAVGANAPDVVTFADGRRALWKRSSVGTDAAEIAAYEFAKELGSDMITPTVMREGASVRLFIENASPARDWAGTPVGVQGDYAFIKLFDFAIGNIDRHAGNLLIDNTTKRLYMIDHGVSFDAHQDFWDYLAKRELPIVYGGGDATPEQMSGMLERFRKLRDNTAFRSKMEQLLPEPQVDDVWTRLQLILAVDGDLTKLNTTRKIDEVLAALPPQPLRKQYRPGLMLKPTTVHTPTGTYTRRQWVKIHETGMSPEHKQAIRSEVDKIRRWKLSTHAQERMKTKGVDLAALKNVVKHGRPVEFHTERGTRRALLRDDQGNVAVVDLDTQSVVTAYWNDPRDEHRTLRREEYDWGKVPTEVITKPRAV